MPVPAPAGVAVRTSLRRHCFEVAACDFKHERYQRATAQQCGNGARPPTKKGRKNANAKLADAFTKGYRRKSKPVLIAA
jgi:hypothetical protein